ncbi:hypothetical protein [Streptomyces sp. V1I6]|uniref:hypothetical protein n=1 Tax=Streptomyces sp. V1I6 TaxID=3042273 RepID=UPI00277E8C64|nr:hypothetical protein [Streptomyces sp. V1I6]MDQ0840916.1 hypothetical protein [Streptomyces sp. V1I6]
MGHRPWDEETGAGTSQPRGDTEVKGDGRSDVHARATELGIAGRSSMSRDELLQALTGAGNAAA